MIRPPPNSPLLPSPPLSLPPSNFPRDVPADIFKTLAPEQLDLAGDMLDACETVIVLKSAFPKRRSGHPQARVLDRSEEHTSELQSQSNLVCRLLLEITQPML